jgi:hypothetical protein
MTRDNCARHFTEPEPVGPGSFPGCIAGSESGIRTLGIDHGQVPAETAVGLSPAAAAQLRTKNAGRRVSDD